MRRSKELGRLHTAQEALDAVEDRARGVRALLVRPDLCAAAARRRRPGAPSSSARIDEAAEHLSLYQLTIEQDTPFAALHAAGKLVDARTTITRARSTT